MVGRCECAACCKTSACFERDRRNKPEMRRNNAQRHTFQLQIDNQRPARLQAGQLEGMHVMDHAAPRQDQIAMPAMAAAVFRRVHRHQIGCPLQQGEIEQAVAIAQPLVGFLQGDHIGADLGNHLGSALRVEDAVDADAFVDVVGGDGGAGIAILGGVHITRAIAPQRGHQGTWQVQRARRASFPLNRRRIQFVTRAGSFNHESLSPGPHTSAKTM